MDDFYEQNLHDIFNFIFYFLFYVGTNHCTAHKAVVDDKKRGDTADQLHDERQKSTLCLHTRHQSVV